MRRGLYRALTVPMHLGRAFPHRKLNGYCNSSRRGDDLFGSSAQRHGDMPPWLLPVLCVADLACDRGTNATLNSAPLLLQRPGAQVSLKSGRLHEIPDPELVMTETWSLMKVALDRFGPAGVRKFFNAALIFAPQAPIASR